MSNERRRIRSADRGCATIALQDEANRCFSELLQHFDALLTLSRTDHLTQLLNPRALAEHLTAASDQFAATGDPYSLILADIDDFKAYNTYNGRLDHGAGDAVLQGVADVLRALVREDDAVLLFRRGGDEFTIIMRGVTAAVAAGRAIEISRALRGEEFPYRTGKICKVTMSFGVAGCPEDGLTCPAVVECAARALAKAKEIGPGAVCRTPVDASA